MKVVWRTMAGIGLFVVPFAVVYWILSTEESGTVLLLGVPLALLLLGAYVLGATRRSAPLPEDRTDGVAPSEDVIGRFPTASIWPAVVGGGATLAAFGFAFSPWLALPGLGLLVLGLGGMALESAAAD